MTAAELRSLADADTPPEAFDPDFLERGQAYARLVALAPDLARLCAELGEALRSFVAAVEAADLITVEPSYALFEDALRGADTALAKLSELKP